MFCQSFSAHVLCFRPPLSVALVLCSPYLHSFSYLFLPDPTSAHALSSVFNPQIACVIPRGEQRLSPHPLPLLEDRAPQLYPHHHALVLNSFTILIWSSYHTNATICLATGRCGAAGRSSSHSLLSFCALVRCSRSLLLSLTPNVHTQHQSSTSILNANSER